MLVAIVGILAVLFIFTVIFLTVRDEIQARRAERETTRSLNGVHAVPVRASPVAGDRNIILGRTNGSVQAGQLVVVDLPTPGLANHRTIYGGAAARSDRADAESAALMLELARTELIREATPAERASPLFAEMEKVADGGWVGSSPTLHHHDEVHAQLSPPESFTAADLSPSHDSTPSHDSSPSSSFDGGSSDSGGSSGGDW